MGQQNTMDMDGGAWLEMFAAEDEEAVKRQMKERELVLGAALGHSVTTLTTWNINDPCRCGSEKKYRHCCFIEDSIRGIYEEGT